jgi:hypothetical protein
MSTKKRPLDFSLPSPLAERLIVINPLSKGRIGKTTFYEYFVAALERNNIDWQGANLDDRHEAFQQRHPARVKNFHSEGGSAVDEYLPVFTAARRSNAPIYLVDQRAQADRNFLEAADNTNFLRQAAQEGIGVVAVCIALDDFDYLLNLSEAISQLASQGVNRWVVVNHPLIAANVSFPRTPAMRQLERLNAVTINLPAVSKLTFNRLAHLAALEGSAVGFRDAAAHEDWQSGDAAMCRSELENAMRCMELQFRKYPEVFLPLGVSFLERDPATQAPASSPDKAAERAAYSQAFLG